MLRVIVTGNLGFVGSALTKHLKDLGHSVIGIDAGYFRDCAAVDPAEPDEQLLVDTRELTELPQADAVVQLAALSNDPLGELNPNLTHDINVTGSLKVAEAAKRAGIKRFIFASSCSMYGVSEGGEAMTETSKQNPQTAYAQSKVDAEAAILTMTDETFRPISFRFATAYGFSARPRLDIVVNNLIACVISRGEIVLESDGTPWRPLVHVNDMARAITAGITSDVAITGGQAYNVGCDAENYQVRDIAALVSEAFGGIPLKIGTATGADTRSYRVSFEKFSAMFPAGVPQERLAKALEILRRDYTASVTPEDYGGQRFFRLRWIKRLLDSESIDNSLHWTRALETSTKP